MLSSSWSLLPLPLLAAIAEGAHHVVTVGNGGLKFDPENMPAAIGDTVEYRFFAKKHSVTQSSFSNPCVPLDGGFFSGFTPTESPDVAAPTTFTITVNDTKPIWAYCSQTNGDHCQNGMVHSINAPSSGSNTLDAFKGLAKKADKPSISPPDIPAGGVRKLRVEVGSNGLTFTPSNITELPGTVVEFSFNPKNHSVVQSTFDNPCQPQDYGFSSGFIPTSLSPSGVTFDIVVPDTKPIWFYCAQTTGNHCQSGMVGSINAPAQGPNTLEAFIAKAKTAKTPSSIPPHAPLLGTVRINGTISPPFNGAVLLDDALATDASGSPAVPSPGAELPSQMTGMAGGGSPASYSWPPSMSDSTTSLLQLLQYIDDILSHVLWTGHGALESGGAWAGVYPASIVGTIGSMAAQSLVHRSTATDCLSHYQKTLLPTCSYKTRFDGVDDFLHAAEKLLLLAIGVLTDVSARLAADDPWLVPALVSGVGAKSRMMAVVNMMLDHLAAAAPREVVIPAKLAWSYATTHYVESCPGGGEGQGQGMMKGMPDKTWPVLSVEGKTEAPGGGRTTGVTLKWEEWDRDKEGKTRWAAWIGPWGGLEFTEVGKDGKVSVPASLYGHVWVVVTSKKEVNLAELADVTVAGPEVLWVSQP